MKTPTGKASIIPPLFAAHFLPLTVPAPATYSFHRHQRRSDLLEGTENVATKKKKSAEVVGIVGVGLDNQDGHQRLTRTDNFVLVGGSQETHERMQDVSIHFNEALDKRGKHLAEASVPEIIDLMREALDRK